jgi:hypothetical protein
MVRRRHRDSDDLQYSMQPSGVVAVPMASNMKGKSNWTAA